MMSVWMGGATTWMICRAEAGREEIAEDDVERDDDDEDDRAS